jgi:transcriptional regulator with XRE-family HTH domain
VTVTHLIKRRLRELGLEQRDLAEAAKVTESYISQLLTGRRSLPAPDRTDIYGGMEDVMRLPPGRLASMVEQQHRAALLRTIGTGAVALYPDVREMVLRKCRPVRRAALKTLFEQRPFGELERLVTQTILDLLKETIREGMKAEEWLETAGAPCGRGAEIIRSMALGFQEVDVLDLPQETFVGFLECLIESWDIDLPSFEITIMLYAMWDRPTTRSFHYVERPPVNEETPEPGLREFLRNPDLCSTATDREVEFFRGLRFTTGRPTALYFYREMQNLRDPLHIIPTN